MSDVIVGDPEDSAEAWGEYTFGSITPGTGDPMASQGEIKISGNSGSFVQAAEDLRDKVKDLRDRNAVESDAAWSFMEACGLSATNDAVGQLVDAFLPALRIMCERGYDPEGQTWREAGWRGLLHEIRKKNTRLHHRSWLRGLFDWDSAVDCINYLGFYIRMKNEGKPWGALGEPGSLSDLPATPALMGDYSGIND